MPSEPIDTDSDRDSRLMSFIKRLQSLWWICMAFVLLGGALLNLIGYDYGLPYIENVDEGFILTETYTLRGLYGDGSLGIPGYPPLFCGFTI